MGYEQAAIRSSRFFSSKACASARSRGVIINPAAVIPAPVALKNSRRSTPWCRLSIFNSFNQPSAISCSNFRNQRLLKSLMMMSLNRMLP
jgi:hypothetical protein